MGNIKHAKTAAADDGTAEVNANEWNAAHTIEDGTIQPLHIQAIGGESKVTFDPTDGHKHDGTLVRKQAHADLLSIGENDHHTKFTTTEHDVTARHTLGTVVPHDTLANLTTKPHSALTGVTADQHHTQIHKTTHARSGGDPLTRAGVIVDPNGYGDYATIQAAIDSLS